MCLLRNRGLHKLCASQSYGIADPSADDSSTGRGVVLGRAATKLRSIETQPLTGGSTSRRLVDSSFVRYFCSFYVGGVGENKYTVLTSSTVGLPRPKTWRVPVKWIQNSQQYYGSYCETSKARDFECFCKVEWAWRLWAFWHFIVGITKPETWRWPEKWTLRHWFKLIQCWGLGTPCKTLQNQGTRNGHNTSVHCRVHQAWDLVELLWSEEHWQKNLAVLVVYLLWNTSRHRLWKFLWNRHLSNVSSFMWNTWRCVRRNSWKRPITWGQNKMAQCSTLSYWCTQWHIYIYIYMCCFPFYFI